VFKLEIARECLQASTPGVHVSGYIEQLGIHPFHVLFYTEGQIVAYVAQCKSAVGAQSISTLRDPSSAAFPDKKTTYYYCMLMSDRNLPVLDILSSCHEASWIQGMIMSFNSSVRRVNSGRLVTPKYVVTDFSYALMHACIQAMNEGMQLAGYLQLT